jgi:2TM domain
MQSATEVGTSTTSRREQAIKRLKAKNDFKVHLVVYLTVNTMLVLVWFLTSSGYFWPIWPMAGWGIGVVMHGYSVYWGAVFTEQQIQREMESLS